MPTSRLNPGGLPFAVTCLVVAASSAVPLFAQRATLKLTPPSDAQRLIEHTKQDVAFVLTLEKGRRRPHDPPEIPFPMDVLVCSGEGEPGEPCTEFKQVMPKVALNGTLSVQIPAGGKDVPIKLVACKPEADANQVPHCGRQFGRADFKRPVFARFVAGIDSFTIHHTRARTSDTVYLGYVGLFAQKALDDATSKALEACDNIIGQASVEQPILCRNQARYGMDDLGDGTYPGRKDLGVGVFEVVPGAGGRLNFGYVLFNFGFPGEPPDARNQMIGNSHNVIRGQLVTETVIRGTFEINPTPLDDITDKLNGSPWLGCDGPTAGGIFSIPNDNSASALDALTNGSGEHVASKEFVVKSQVGCGDSSRYSVAWFVRRTTWQP